MKTHCKKKEIGNEKKIWKWKYMRIEMREYGLKTTTTTRRKKQHLYAPLYKQTLIFFFIPILMQAINRGRDSREEKKIIDNFIFMTTHQIYRTDYSLNLQWSNSESNIKGISKSTLLVKWFWDIYARLII